MSDAYRTRLIEPETSLLKKASAAVVGLGFLTFLFAWLTLFEVVSLETRYSASACSISSASI